MSNNTADPSTHQAALDAALAPLLAKRHWVKWKYKTLKSGKLTKVPYQCNGYPAATDNPRTWTTYDAVVRAADKFDGDGFVLTDSGLGAFDIDKCRDPATGIIHPWAQALVERCNSYAEITPSGTGLRIIGTSSLPALKCGPVPVPDADGVKCEIFRNQGYITITGKVLKSAPLADLDSQIENVMRELALSDASSREEESPTGSDEIKSEWFSKYMPEGLPPGEGRGFEPPVKPEKIKAALDAADPDTDRKNWIKVGCSLLKELDEEKGFEFWNEWSSRGKKYPGLREMQKQWRSLVKKDGYDYNIGSLFWLADQTDPEWRQRFEDSLRQESNDDNESDPGLNDIQDETVDKTEESKAEDNNGDSNGPALSIEDWLNRNLPKPDFICGKWLTTTSRVILYAPTGIGKTLFGLGLGMSIASAINFLHRQATRPVRVLFVDGEMARRVIKERIAAELSRIGGVLPENMYLLSREDVDDFHPLNSREGRALIEQEIERIGGVDLIIFDNIMSLIKGDMREEESWSQVLPWIKSLTRRSIAQIWIHHTGHDETHGYGTKTKEWQMDTVIKLERVERRDTDVSFLLHFEKAREREPSTRADFADVKIALVGDKWVFQTMTGARQGKPTPKGQRFYEALLSACNAEKNGRPATTIENWREACIGAGLLERGAVRAQFHNYKVELITKNWIGCDETWAWTIGSDREEVF